MKNINFYIKKIDWRTFSVFLLLSLTPAIWNLIRAQIITHYMSASLDTLAQWSYVNIALEMLHEGMVLPLFWWFGKSLKVNNQSEFNVKVKTSLSTIAAVYFVVLSILSFFVGEFVNVLGSNQGHQQKLFFLFELWAKLPTTLFFVSTVVLISLKKWKEVLILTACKLVFAITFDFTLANEAINGQSFSGLGLSSLLNSLLMFIVSFILIVHSLGWKLFFKKEKLFFEKSLLKNVGYSMGDSFVRNIFYLLMVAKMINDLSGDSASIYWLTNEVIWSWILLPLTMMTHIQKSIISLSNEPQKTDLNITLTFFGINQLMFIFLALFFFAVWNPFVGFMTNNDIEKINLSKQVFVTIIWFYIFYVTSETIIASVHGQGKQYLIIVQSIMVNIIVYVPLYIFYLLGNLTFSLTTVALMFGFSFLVGMIFNVTLYLFNFLIEYNKEKNKLVKKVLKQ